MRRPHSGQVSRAPHSGQSFQATFTSAPHAGQANRTSGCPHIGHTFHVSLTGSPQAVHLFFGSIPTLLIVGPSIAESRRISTVQLRHFDNCLVTLDTLQFSLY
jgi:hypothetical protein